ncbi:hypothetical protein JOB18_003980, partial [Solea senegalensis]
TETVIYSKRAAIAVLLIGPNCSCVKQIGTFEKPRSTCTAVWSVCGAQQCSCSRASD